MLTFEPTSEARIAIEPDFTWDAQDAYLFDIDGTLLRSRDRVHVDSFVSSVHRVTGFEVTLAGLPKCWNRARRPFLRPCATR